MQLEIRLADTTGRTIGSTVLIPIISGSVDIKSFVLINGVVLFVNAVYSPLLMTIKLFLRLSIDIKLWLRKLRKAINCIVA